jgi:hypothetical protein
MSRFVLVAVGLVWLVIGMWALVDPVGLAGVTAVKLEGDGGPIEVRAMYGGLGVGMSAFLLWCAMRHEWLRTGLACVILTIGGMAVTRGAFVVLRPPQPTVHMVFAVLEIATTVMAIVAWWQARVPPKPLAAAADS